MCYVKNTFKSVDFTMNLTLLCSCFYAIFLKGICNIVYAWIFVYTWIKCLHFEQLVYNWIFVYKWQFVYSPVLPKTLWLLFMGLSKNKLMLKNTQFFACFRPYVGQPALDSLPTILVESHWCPSHQFRLFFTKKPWKM